jgi:hypothetical protein
LRREPVRRAGKKFRAFRAWTLDGYRLRSANPAGGYWTAGVNHAECRRSSYAPSPLQMPWAVPAGGSRPSATHEAPDPKCHCGLYAWYEPRRLARFMAGDAELVYGVVLAWGRVEVHADGFRAEYAEPALLSYSESQSYRHVRRVQAIGSELGIPVVELDELEDAAQAFGEPVPMELRPKRPSPFELDPRLVAAGGLVVAMAGLLEGVRQAQRRAPRSPGGSSPPAAADRGADPPAERRY